MKRKKIFIAGDSTSCIYPHFGKDNSFPRTGWGQVIDRFLPEYIIVDLALSGRSSRSFKTEENYKYLRENISSGDYLIIQFGHNDSKEYDPERYCAPENEYPDSLMEYVEIARKRNAIPILATSISRNYLSDKSLETYVKSMRELADKEAIHLIDAYKMTNDYINRVGVEESVKLYMNVAKDDERFIDDIRFENSKFRNEDTWDNVHLNINGALFVAEFMADEIRELIREK